MLVKRNKPGQHTQIALFVCTPKGAAVGSP
ncbi:hypothetical protein MCEMSEM23_01769 [Rhabdaerophilaceae bacterium]